MCGVVQPRDGARVLWDAEWGCDVFVWELCWKLWELWVLCVCGSVCADELCCEWVCGREFAWEHVQWELCEQLLSESECDWYDQLCAGSVEWELRGVYAVPMYDSAVSDGELRHERMWIAARTRVDVRSVVCEWVLQCEW